MLERVNRLVVQLSEFSNESVWALWCLHGRRQPEGWTVDYSQSGITSAPKRNAPCLSGPVAITRGCERTLDVSERV
jgi:hypothetical protein